MAFRYERVFVFAPKPAYKDGDCGSIMIFYSSGFSDIAVKFCEKPEYAEEMAAGNIYMKESAYFRQLEDTFRGDAFDGQIRVIKKIETVPFRFSDGTVADCEMVSDVSYGLPNGDKIPIFCATMIDSHIVDPVSERTGVFCEEFQHEISQFGRYAVCFSVNEFIDKAYDKILRDQWPQFGKVAYLNYHDIFPVGDEESDPGIFYGLIDLYSGNTIENIFYNRRDLMLFRKDTSYQWQNEWRFVLRNDRDNIIPENRDYHILSLGKLESARIYELDDILNANIAFDSF